MVNRIILSSLSFSLLVCYSNIQAAGFAIIENSASGMGNAFAGAAAVGEDASTIWFNPAGMSRLGNKASISQSGHLIIPSAKFTDKGSSVNPVLTGGNTDAAVATLTGPNDNADNVAFVPNLYYVKPLNDRMHIGVGVNAPFGLEVSYGDDWIGRYIATTSEMKTININPSISWKANDRLALGAGISLQYAEVTLGSAIDSAAACRSAASAANSSALLGQCLTVFPKVGQSATDSSAEIEGDNIAYGLNIGLLFNPTNKTRIGASYRSKISHTLEGKANFTVNDSLANVFVAVPTAANPSGVKLQQALQTTRLKTRDVTADAKLPDSLSLSVAHNYTNKIELLADATWTGWSSFEELRVVDSTGSDVALTPEKWDDVWRLSIGGNYKYSDKLTLRTGVAFDESPIPSAELRTPRIPGNDRTWASLGAGYKINDHMNMDLGFSHLFVDDTPINHTSSDNGYTVKGVYEADINIVSAQFNMKF